MKPNNKIIAVTMGTRADIGPYKIDRIIPNRYANAIGPFVFLDHILPLTHKTTVLNEKTEGTGPHPHRGIATLSYIINGKGEHKDSIGNHTIVHSGGAQWMKAGNGIIHDESLSIDPDAEPITHSFQFWINLPSKNKKENPEYISLESSKIPKVALDNGAGWLKIVAGSFKQIVSEIPSYTSQIIYHLHLNAENCFTMHTIDSMEYATFLPLQDANINEEDYHQGELQIFEKSNGKIQIKNLTHEPLDIIIFGGETYSEPIVAAGPFVMNTQHEISVAYNDYYDGKYGSIE